MLGESQSASAGRSANEQGRPKCRRARCARTRVREQGSHTAPARTSSSLPCSSQPKLGEWASVSGIQPGAVSCSRWPAYRRGRRHQGAHQARPRPGLQHATLAWQRGVCGGLLRSPLVLALLLQSCRGGCSSPLVGGSPCYRQLRATAPCVGCRSSATSPYLQS